MRSKKSSPSPAAGPPSRAASNCAESAMERAEIGRGRRKGSEWDGKGKEEWDFMGKMGATLPQ